MNNPCRLAGASITIEQVPQPDRSIKYSSTIYLEKIGGGQVVVLSPKDEATPELALGYARDIVRCVRLNPYETPVLRLYTYPVEVRK